MLGELSVVEFLARYWQKRPLLIRDAIRDWRAPVARDELFALAGEGDVASRLITMPGEERGWAVRRGPFDAAELGRLPERGWTLLIQEIDRRVGGFAELLERFRFLPNWRIDDVMVSYAPDGGGVGPHIDRYDVFLLQGAGRRRWRIASRPLEREELLPGVELPVLAEFEPDMEWVLEPGDMLYLPPRIAHEGVAVGSSLTCSVGFRAPDPRELCSGFLRQLSPKVFDEIRYSDPDLQPAERVGEIPPEAREQLRESARSLFAGAEFDRWVGRFVTTPLRKDRPEMATRPCAIEGVRELKRSAAPHFAWHREHDGIVQLFVGGESYELGQGAEATAELLCGRARLDRAVLDTLMSDEVLACVVTDLVLRGYLVYELS